MPSKPTAGLTDLEAQLLLATFIALSKISHPSACVKATQQTIRKSLQRGGWTIVPTSGKTHFELTKKSPSTTS